LNGTRARRQRTSGSTGCGSRKAVFVFSDDAAITILDDDADEERFVTLGMGLKGRVLAVAYCYRGDNIRIISVRTAGRSEREQYEAPR